MDDSDYDAQALREGTATYAPGNSDADLPTVTVTASRTNIAGLLFLAGLTYWVLTRK